MTDNSEKLIDGKMISNLVKDEIKEKTAAFKERYGRDITLAVMLVGEDPASQVYVRNKKRACEYVGFSSRSIELPASISQEEVLSHIDRLNIDEAVDGILVQLPVPAHIDSSEIIRRIRPDKDVDGFHPMNVGALVTGEKGFVSCTPAGVMELLKRYNVEISGKRAVVAGRSNIVGKPMAQLLLKENATVTIAHSKTADLPAVCREADILVAAIGKGRFFGPDYIKEGAVVIDVGINRDPDTGKLSGDVDLDAVIDKVGLITPVPGGVGPMTIAMLMKNCYEAALMHQGAI